MAAEVAWLARRPGPVRRAILRSAATATTMAVGALAVGVSYTAALRFLWNLVATQRWEAAVAFWSDHRLLGVLVAFVAWDASGWVYHLIGHRTRIGWAAHQPHHSGEGYDATLLDRPGRRSAAGFPAGLKEQGHLAGDDGRRQKHEQREVAGEKCGHTSEGVERLEGDDRDPPSGRA